MVIARRNLIENTAKKKNTLDVRRCWETRINTFTSFFAYNEDSFGVLVLLLELLKTNGSATQRCCVVTSLSVHHSRHHQSPNVFRFDLSKMKSRLAQNVGK